MFDPAVDNAGTYKYTVQSTNEVCPADSAVITVNITPAPNAGADIDDIPAFCTNQDEEISLYDYIPEGTSMEGTFEGLEDGMFNPSELAPDTYTYIYSVIGSGGCDNTDTAIYTITVQDAPIAPTVADYSACAVAGATVAELADNITGDDGATFNVYTDAEMNDMVADTDVLMDGTYYVTQTSAAGCESDAAMLEVTLTDTAAPTLVQGGNVFCEFDGATLAELEQNVNANGVVTWYTSATGDETYTLLKYFQTGYLLRLCHSFRRL